MVGRVAAVEVERVDRSGGGAEVGRVEDPVDPAAGAGAFVSAEARFVGRALGMNLAERVEQFWRRTVVVDERAVRLVILGAIEIAGDDNGRLARQGMESLAH